MTIYRGLSGVNRLIKSEDRGLEGVSRSIKEQYRGLSGVNRRVFSVVPAGSIYYQGDECMNFTGGWDVNKKASSNDAVYEKRTKSIYLYTGTTGNLYPSEKTAYAETTNLIDVTNFSALKINILNSSNSSAAGTTLSLITTKNTPSNGTQEAGGSMHLEIPNGASGILTLNLASLTGSYRISIRVYASYSSTNYRAAVEFDSIRLE